MGRLSPAIMSMDDNGWFSLTGAAGQPIGGLNCSTVSTSFNLYTRDAVHNPTGLGECELTRLIHELMSSHGQKT